MFSFYSVILDLIKARTHKYVRRIPVGATKTGATKYRYFYHGQEGHGKGLAHESELVEGASFVFSEGENRYHAHITKVDGNMITVKHDDGAKKGTEHIYTKEAFQKLVRFEHRKALEQAKQKASKQLSEFQQMKELGAKVKQETLDKLQAQVNKLAFIDSDKPKQEETKQEETKQAPKQEETKQAPKQEETKQAPKQEETKQEETKQDIASKDATLDRIVNSVSKLKKINSAASAMSTNKSLGKPGLHVPISDYDIFEDIQQYAHQNATKTMRDLKKEFIDENLVSDTGEINYSGLESFLKGVDADTKEASQGFTVVINKKWDKREKARWENDLKPALSLAGLEKMDILSFDNGLVMYSIPIHVLNKSSKGASDFIRHYFSDDRLPPVEVTPITQDHMDIINEYNAGTYKGYNAFFFEDDNIGEEMEDEDFEGKDADTIRLYVEGSFDDRDDLRRKGFTFAQKKDGGKGISYYRFNKPLSQMSII